MQVRKQLYCALYTYARKRKSSSGCASHKWSLSTVGDLLSKQALLKIKMQYYAKFVKIYTYLDVIISGHPIKWILFSFEDDQVISIRPIHLS